MSKLNSGKMRKQLYPIGAQDFEKIIANEMVYIDKTALIYNLVKTPRYIFLARPRRFGKSLLLSTIKAYFEGKKDLFKGLKIYDLEQEWKRYEVLHLSFANLNANNEGSLLSSLDYQFSEWENKYGITPRWNEPAQRFQHIIRQVYEKSGGEVVILVDEYDQALINTLHKNEIYEANRELLKSIYANFKDMDAYIRFGMITGVSRFSKTSIFSGLNNIRDISFLDDYSSICGFTECEIREYLWPGVENLAQGKEISPEEALLLLKNHYDGYHFSRKSPDIYNPFSVLNALEDRNISNYWISSGTPEFLVKELGKGQVNFINLFNSEEVEEALTTNDVAMQSPAALLYQTGYLTIKSYDEETGIYYLGIPNREVDYGLFGSLLTYFSGCNHTNSLKRAIGMRKALTDGDPEEFLIELQSFFAGIPYSLHPDRYELNFEKILYSIIRLIGLEVSAESETSDGRIDLLIRTDRYIYLIELKQDKSPEEAMQQIEKKGYSLGFKSEGKEKLFKIGICYSSQTRNLSSWLIKEEI